MFSEIPLGQFVPGNSFLHKLDPRAKIIFSLMFVTSIFFCINYVSSALLLISSFLIIFVSGIPVRLYLKSLKMILIIVGITATLNLFYGSGNTILKVGVLRITDEAVASSVFVMTRITSLIIISSSLTFTTSINHLADAVESLMSPLKFFKVDVHSIAMMMTIALRFVPSLLDETDKIMLAQKSRGANFETGKLTKRIRALVPIFVPLFISSFRRAYDLATAMECRCYRGGKGRTCLKKFKFSRYDLVAFFFVLTICAGVVVCGIVF